MNRTASFVLMALGTLHSVGAAQEPVDIDLLQRLSTTPDAVSRAMLAQSHRAPPAVTAENVAAFFDAAFNVQRQDHALVGAVVSVVYEGQLLYKRGYGFADLERGIAADPDRSLFRIASISKPFSWTAIMQLVEQGRLQLDADIGQYLDFEIPATYSEPIRVWHLLTHTGGFEETWRAWGARDADDVGELGAKLEELMPARVWPPGKHAAYSNYGASLAGYIVQRVSGQPWHEYIERHVLGPLAMTSTNARIAMPPDLKERLAKGYVYQGGEFVPTAYTYSQLGPAGLMSSTASDMARFMLAHLNHGELGGERILQEKTSRLMQSPLFVPDPELPPLLHGFYRSDRNGQVVFGHGGDTNQFHSNMSMLPDHGLGVFVSFNSDPGAAARSSLMPAFLDHFFPPEHSSPAPEPVEVDLSAYAGDYVPLRGAFSTFERMRILLPNKSVRAEGRDELRINGQSGLVATGHDRFTRTDSDVVIVFQRDASGEVTHMLAGSPLSTYLRTRGLQSPRNIVTLMNVALFVALAAVLGWGYRVFRPAPEEERLPSPHVRLAWLHALLLGSLMLLLPAALQQIGLGVSTWAHVLLLASNANLVLGLVVVAFSVRQWVGGHGTPWNRSRYSLVALAAVFNMWFAWSFNLVAYLF